MGRPPIAYEAHRSRQFPVTPVAYLLKYLRTGNSSELYHEVNLGITA